MAKLITLPNCQVPTLYLNIGNNTQFRVQNEKPYLTTLQLTLVFYYVCEISVFSEETLKANKFVGVFCELKGERKKL